MPQLRRRSVFGDGFWRTIKKNLNFFRIHLLFFTFTPLISSAVLYASSGRYPISYIDALFNSVSAVTVCGLATVNLSGLTPWQQAILFLQMCVGSPVVVSWVMVYIRRYFFAKKFDHIIEAEAARRAALKMEAQLTRESAAASGRQRGFARRVTSLFRRRNGLSTVPEDTASEDDASTPREKDVGKKLRTDMIRRMDAPPKLVNPSGWISEGGMLPLKRFSAKSGDGPTEAQSPDHPSSPRQLTFAEKLTRSPERQAIDLCPDPEVRDVHIELDGSQIPSNEDSRPSHPRRLSDPGTPGRMQSGPSGGPLLKSSTLHVGPQSSKGSIGMPRTATVEFAPTVARHHIPLSPVPSRGRNDMQEPLATEGEGGRSWVSRDDSHSRRRSTLVGGRAHVPMTQNPTQNTYRSSRAQAMDQSEFHQPAQKLSGFGGFPMPHEILGSIFRRVFPTATTRLQRTVTIPITTTLTGGGLGRTYTGSVHALGGRSASISGPGGGSVNAADGSKSVAYISFDAIVGRNSAFHMLTNEQLEELGGVEFRALNALLWLVAGYHIGIQLISFIVIASYMTLPKWAGDFVPPALLRTVAPPWFALFQVVSAYTNTGMSLVDQSMVPFQTAYPMIFFLMLCILAGNTAFPIFLRFLIWIITKFVPANSRLDETLHFLLDHPRRCFIYLFPSHQTWFLFTILLALNLTDWFCFLVLDIGNSVIDSIPLGTRFVAGLLQAIAVRAAGFGIVPLAALAPAVRVMYVIMMYISVYPIALSVRSTNVYEEQSLGIFRSDDGMSDEERAFQPTGSRMTVWSRYLAMHARRQLSFDMWWLSMALFLVCIIERDNLTNPDVQGWFNIFTIIFELVSAYGTVGLSLGIPTENYSFSGALRPLSKLIVCLVMLRGRHRGLPVAIDRAVMLPSEFKKPKDDLDSALQPGGGEQRSSRYSTGNTNRFSVGPVDDESQNQSQAEQYDEVIDEQPDGMEMKRRSSSTRRDSSEDALVEASRRQAFLEDPMMSQ
ncbi:hypothetical protein HYDPIDRAFT_110073 [Hydnomerulius pinastri MD-312]|nr:hypothetical protein HYDPIDRAFT_110073 [Hydnomerulius pinastri MD-312]